MLRPFLCGSCKRGCITILNLKSAVLKDLVNHRLYKLRKKVDLFLNRLFPNKWIPLYSMVTFTRTPYHQIVEERKRQDRLLTRLRNGLLVSTAIALVGLYCAKRMRIFQRP
ncbi:hypothetical protein OESDEN_10865 [Oesophagostomum dentatum]|uniref:Uncharacterized protein n=1 Tax=Oesophagostomum dentatum TaxID=61180 RepID=A0A0B1SVH5_OESDE|nr:hypothetical protein OESDEN_10865 [Oesophagostomum dentatum]